MHPLCTNIISGYSSLSISVALASFAIFLQKYAERL